jgi:hypothetical protein
LTLHVVRQLVALAQTYPPGQSDPAAPLQMPEPLQVALGVKVEPTQEAGAHTVAALANAHAPPAPQTPVKPQAVVGEHWPAAGGALPANTGAQVPFGWPVKATLHAWQVPLHALPQHTPLTHCPLWHWPFELQA